MGVAVKAADAGDRELVVRVLDAAFQDDPVSAWVFPGDEYRRTTHSRLMAAFTDIVLAEGRVDVTEDGTGCALWLSVPAGEHADDEGPARLRDAVDPANERIEQIGRLAAALHPSDRAHDYLWMIGVVPEHQGRGLGTALIRPVLDRCDREGLPVYLEASNARSRRLYERLGFVCTGRAPDLPEGGPRMWPMWREPKS
ncbi:GNAT family N-acetyltransferase [Streptomyces sp. HUAS ZL42]|uniref:GNAT family N-acetyltransferase n=1 Tax=Streptomyces sp. HUAS ZL42 TaxID=3231715 RepID=UPI00345E0A4A